VGCVVVSRSRKKADGEQGIVSVISSASSMVIISRASDGVRGRAFECRIGEGEELRAIIIVGELLWAYETIGVNIEASSALDRLGRGLPLQLNGLSVWSVLLCPSYRSANRKQSTG
jgi:hypothetical protein